MPRTKKKKEEEVEKEPTIEEKIKIVLAHYGKLGRHERRMWGKLVGLKIPGLIKSFKKGEYKPEVKKSKDNALCKNAKFVENKKTKELENKGCINLRANGSSRCGECSNGKK
jgi:hypothetical protein